MELVACDLCRHTYKKGRGVAIHRRHCMKDNIKHMDSTNPHTHDEENKDEKQYTTYKQPEVEKKHKMQKEKHKPVKLGSMTEKVQTYIDEGNLEEARRRTMINHALSEIFQYVLHCKNPCVMLDMIGDIFYKHLFRMQHSEQNGQVSYGKHTKIKIFEYDSFMAKHEEQLGSFLRTCVEEKISDCHHETPSCCEKHKHHTHKLPTQLIVTLPSTLSNSQSFTLHVSKDKATLSPTL